MNKSKIIFAAAFFIFAGSSCKKGFYDINDNPNQVTEDKITSELILPSALHLSGATIQNYGFLNRWMGYWSNSGSFAPVEEEVTYNITTSFGSIGGIWNSYYNALFDLYNVEQKATVEGIPFYAAIAKVMKAKMFQDLVDQFGNVPYSQAFKTAEFPTPKFDKGEEIYRDLQLVLDSAIAIFATKPVPARATTVDVIYAGNKTLWTQFANTIKLRLLIRQSEIPGFSPTAELAKITANGAVLMSGQSAEVNPGYANAVNQQSPFYASWGLTTTGTNASEVVRANTYLLNIYKTTNDPRLSRVFLPAASPANATDPYVGTTYGAAPSTAFGGQQTSYIGPGLSKSSSQDQWILTSVESMFLYAEAVARGWFTADAQTAYESAVRESFIWLGVPDAVNAANSYMAANTVANWANSGATSMDKVRFIVYQKYIAMAGLNALEAWSDYRRLGIPTNVPLSVDPGRIGSGLPIRLLYPAAEYAVNAANAQAQGTINQFTSKVFWDQ